MGSVLDALKDMTGGRGPDACIDAVGMEAHGKGADYAYDRVKQALRLESDRAQALRSAIRRTQRSQAPGFSVVTFARLANLVPSPEGALASHGVGLVPAA